MRPALDWRSSARTQCPYEHAPVAHGARKVLGAGSVDARRCHRSRAVGKYIEAAIIAALLAFNAALGLLQESRAQATLAAPKSRLALNASVRRDNVCKTIPAVELVPGDMVKLSLGAVVAADVHLTGRVLDQVMLTGELVPIEASAGVQTYEGLWCAAARRWLRSQKPERVPNSVEPRARSHR